VRHHPTGDLDGHHFDPWFTVGICAPCHAVEHQAWRRAAIADIADLSDDTFVESRDYLRAGDRLLWHTWTDVGLFAQHRARIAELTAALGE